MPARMRWQENPRAAGFSLRTGIPGLSYRQSWGKNAGGAALIMLGIMAAVGIAIVLRILAYLLPLLWQCLLLQARVHGTHDDAIAQSMPSGAQWREQLPKRSRCR
jgi:hypothetical protein